MMKAVVRKRVRRIPARAVLTEHGQECCCWDCVIALNEWVREEAFVLIAARMAERDRWIRMAQFPLTQQIEEVERELALRKEVYPRWVGSGKMRQSVADYHMARMESVLKTLQWLMENETKVKAAMQEKATVA